MKNKWNFVLGSSLLAVTLFSGCLSGTKTEKKKDAVTPVKTQSSDKKSKPVISNAEMAYLKALRERDPKKRNILFKEALKELEKAAEDKKNLKENLLLAYMADLGQGMERNGIKAARHYRIAADGGLEEAKIALAEFWLRNGIFLEDAAKQVQSIPDYQNKPSALCTLGMIRYAQFEYDDGFQYLKRSFELSKNHPQTRVHVLRVIHKAFEQFLKAKNYDAAMRELKREESLDPGNSMIPFFMGEVEFMRGNRKEAEKYLNLSLKKNPAAPYTYRRLAFIKALSERPDEAVDDMKVAYAVSGKNPAYLRDLVEIYIMTKHYDELLKLCSRILKEKPDSKETRQLRAMLYLTQKEYAKAYADLRILMKDPKLASQPEILESFAAAATILGKTQEAEKKYEILMKSGFNPVTALNLAEIYIINCKYDKALTLLRNDGFKNSKDLLVRCVVPYLEASALLAKGEKADSQIKIFEAELPAFVKKYQKNSPWDVGSFQVWLKKVKLSEDARKSITDMTDKISLKKSAAPAAQPAKSQTK